MDFFKRGYVTWTSIPESIHTSETPEPGFFLKGKHLAIVLHDHDSLDIRKDLALVIPITSAKAEVTRAQKEGRAILPSYVPILKADHPFLDNDSYVSTSQPMPVNRLWMDQFLGEVNPGLMELIDFQVIQNIGLMEMVMKMAQSLYQEQLEQMAQEAAAAGEFTDSEE